VLLLVILVNFSPVQNFIVKRATNILSDKLKTKVSIRNIRIDFLNHLLIEDLYIEGRAKDTILHAGRLEVRISDWFFIKKEKPVLSYIGLHNAYAHLYRNKNSDEWNYQFIIDAFDSGPSTDTTTKKKNDFEIDLKKLDIHHVRFHMDDAWVGKNTDIDIGDLQLDAEKLDLKNKKIDVNKIDVEGFAIYLDDYEGGRPPKPKVAKLADTTAFNPDNWNINFDKILLKNCAFNLKNDDEEPLKGQFDPAHMNITGINLDVDGIYIRGDTLRGKITHLSANERCGLNVKELRAKVTVSSLASICEDLYLETNNSILQDYYAMHYHRFTDFNNYIMNVRMEAHFKKSNVDSRDVAFFAPALKEFPARITLSGDIKGSVMDIDGKNLFISDGANTVKGDLHMTGLPDINFTFIDYKNGEVLTSGNGILKYVPSLRNDPNIAIEKLAYVYFKGNYKGYIESFAANGVLTTNLGTIESNVKMDIPNFNTNTAAYSGTVKTTNFNLGALLRQSGLGTLTFNGNIKGNSFDPAIAQIDIKADIGHVHFNGYDYKNIYAEGVLAKKRFEGKALIDDPNLAMAFNGTFDFNDDLPKANATANVLSSNLAALNLTKDSIKLSADFDLNATGSDIDNFIGYAKLYNINLVRNNHRLDVDSIYLNSGFANGEKFVTIESNDFTADLRGNFELSSLPYSFQYYISGYLPNYISPPTQAAPPQEIAFTIKTKSIDSILGVIAPSVSGFENTVMTGSLNTAQQSLSLNLKSANGSIGSVHMYDINVDGSGDFRKLKLDGSVASIVVGDSAVNGKLSLTASLGNDSLLFKVATTSEGSYGTATLNGQAFASGDSLYLTMLPSEFFLNNNKWEIPNGSNVVFSDNYLYVRNLNIESGLQKIAINSADELTTQTVGIKVENLDIEQLAAIVGLEEYDPEGRVNGNLRIDHVFGKQFFVADLKASDVKLLNDTLGNIIVSGNFDMAKDMLFLDPASGIYRGNASVNVYGKVHTDSTSNQRLDGGIRFMNAPLSWAQSAMTGYLSGMSGTVSGEVLIGGTGISPDLKGNVYLSKVSTKVDFLGITYRIPEAKITIDEKLIDLGDIKVYDPNDNVANLSGIITHQRFNNLRLSFSMKANEFDVINLKENESSVFYGNLTAKIDRFNLTGPPNNVKIDITATPVKKSHLFLPVDQGSDVSTYNYIQFATYGQDQPVITKKSNNKVTLVINANLTPDGEITMVIDPTTGDAINASGYGNLKLNIPIGGDITMYGDYLLETGDYTFTFNQLAFKRKFILNQGSKISFKGPISETSLAVEGIYTTKARLYDLLTDNEKTALTSVGDNSEAAETKKPQNVDVKLHMRGTLKEPILSFNLDLQERSSMGTLAYLKLEAINKNERELLDQVASLLLINTFISQQGLGGGGGYAGVAINNISDIVSSSASSQLTNIVSKLLGNENMTIDLKYKNYNLSDVGYNRNEVTGSFTQNLLKDRLIVEVGGSYDWGRPASGNGTSNTFNVAGDFRLQWLLTESGNFRLNLFRNSSYDVLSEANIKRGGLGLSWKKSFNGFDDFFKSRNKRRMENDTARTKVSIIGPVPYDTAIISGGTW
jgi:hypothetical protein